MRRALGLRPALLWTATLGLLLASAVAACARLHGLAEIVSNLRYPLGVAATFLLFFSVLWREPRISLAALLLAGLHLWPVMRLSFAAPPNASAFTGPELRVGSANLFFGFAQPQAVKEWMEREELDVVGFLELKDAPRSGIDWPGVLESWRAEYPHQLVRPGRSFGIALISRFALNEGLSEELAFDDPYVGERPIWLGAEVHVGEQPVSVVLVHPPRPSARGISKSRIQLYRALAELEDDGPLVLLGDLNCTSYSPIFRDLLNEGGFRDTRVGFGLQTSWTMGRVPGRWVAIDHILLRGGLVTLDRGLGPKIQSDHLPVHATLRLR